MILKNIFIALAAGVAMVGCDKYASLPDGVYAVIRPEKGDEVLVKLYYKEVPMTTGSFVALAEGTMQGDIDPAYKGKHFFDSLIFHRVEPNFVVQSGDPLGTGAGGPGYHFPLEIVDSIRHQPGVIAMANASSQTNGSQFYITMKTTSFLDGSFTVFGRMVDPDKNMPAVKAIKQGDRIKEVKIIRRGADAQGWDAAKAFEENKQAYQARIQAMIDEFFKGAQTTESGLKIRIFEQGKGRLYKKGEKASVHYTGKFLDGSMFDSSRSGQPFSFILGQGQVIKGWDEAVAMLPIGTKAVVLVPSAQAYGPQGRGSIPPSTDLIFEMEILEPAK